MTVTPLHGIKKSTPQRFEYIDAGLMDLSREKISQIHPSVARALDLRWIRPKDLSKLKRIRALVDLPLHGVESGDLGGLVTHKDSLSQNDDSWVAFGGVLLGSSTIRQKVLVGNHTLLFSTHALGAAHILGTTSLRRCEISGNGVIHGRFFAEDSTITGCVDLGGHNVRIARSHISGTYQPGDVPVLGIHLDGMVHISDSAISGQPHITDSRIRRSTIDGAPTVRRSTITGSVILDEVEATGTVVAGGCSVGGESRLGPGSSLRSGVKVGGRAIVDGNVVGPYTVLDDVYVPHGVSLVENGPHKVTITGNARLFPPSSGRPVRGKDLADAIEEAQRQFPDATTTGQAFPIQL